MAITKTWYADVDFTTAHGSDGDGDGLSLTLLSSRALVIGFKLAPLILLSRASWGKKALSCTMLEGFPALSSWRCYSWSLMKTRIVSVYESINHRPTFINDAFAVETVVLYIVLCRKRNRERKRGGSICVSRRQSLLRAPLCGLS